MALLTSVVDGTNLIFTTYHLIAGEMTKRMMEDGINHIIEKFSWNHMKLVYRNATESDIKKLGFGKSVHAIEFDSEDSLIMFLLMYADFESVLEELAEE